MYDLLKGAPNWVCKVDTGGQHSKWRKTFESCGKVMWLRSCYRATWIVCFWKLRKVSGYEMFRMFLKEIQKSFDKVCYKTGNQKHPNFLCDEKVEIKSSFLFKTTQRSAQRPHFDQSFMPREISKNARRTALHCGKLDQNFQSLSMILLLCHIIECEKWFLNACLEDGSTWIMKKTPGAKIYQLVLWLALEICRESLICPWDLLKDLSSIWEYHHVWITWLSNSKHFENIWYQYFQLSKKNDLIDNGFIIKV